MLKVTTRRLRSAAQFCVDTLLLLMKKGTPHPDRVLLIRLDAIGDFTLWLDAAQATVKHYNAQGKSVVLVANAAWAAWATQLGIFADVIALERPRFNQDLIYRFRHGRQIRRLGCSIAVQPTYSREWLFGDAIVRTSGAAERIGSAGDTTNMRPWQKRISDRWYTRLISADPAPCMELVRNAEFVRGLGEIGFRAKVADFRKRSGPQMDESFLAAIPAGQPYYVLFPGASWNGKQWPVAGFAQVAEWLHSKTGWSGVVCGGKADHELAETVCGQCTSPLLNWAGRTDLPQLAAILSASQLLLTNDTSATHIAAVFGLPTVCILGGGHYGRFMPYVVEQTDDRPLPRAVIHQMPCFNCNWRCVYKVAVEGPVPCIDRIPVAEVWHAISELLELPA